MKKLICSSIFYVLYGLLPSHAEEITYQVATYTDIVTQATEQLKIYQYQQNPKIIILDFPDLFQQGSMFNRIVALIERMGAPRDRVFTNQELAQYIRSIGRTEATFAFGNDFQVNELVVFFNLAELGSIELNAEEKWLRDFLLSRNWIQKQFGFYQVVPPNRIILSIPQIQMATATTPPVTELARKTILRHELSHGEYFSNPDYANYCRNFWYNTLTENEREHFRQFLSKNAYDPKFEEMMINEMQAYLMHTPDPRGFNANKLGVSEETLLLWRQKFLQGKPPSHLFTLNRT